MEEGSIKAVFNKAAHFLVNYELRARRYHAVDIKPGPHSYDGRSHRRRKYFELLSGQQRRVTYQPCVVAKDLPVGCCIILLFEQDRSTPAFYSGYVQMILLYQDENEKHVYIARQGRKSR